MNSDCNACVGGHSHRGYRSIKTKRIYLENNNKCRIVHNNRWADGHWHGEPARGSRLRRRQEPDKSRTKTARKGITRPHVCIAYMRTTHMYRKRGCFELLNYSIASVCVCIIKDMCTIRDVMSACFVTFNWTTENAFYRKFLKIISFLFNKCERQKFFFCIERHYKSLHITQPSVLNWINMKNQPQLIYTPLMLDINIASIVWSMVSLSIIHDVIYVNFSV